MFTAGLTKERDFSIWDDPIQIDYDRMKLADEYNTNTQGITGVPV